MTIKKKILTTVGGVILILLTIIYLIIIPTTNQIRNLHEAIVSEEKELESKLERGALIKKINEDFQKIKADREKLYSMFIPLGQELEFIQTIENIIENYNLTKDIQLINTGEKTKKDGEIKNILPLKIIVNGDFIQIIKFLNQLEKLNFYFNINKIHLETDDLQRGTVMTTLEGVSYGLIP